MPTLTKEMYDCIEATAEAFMQEYDALISTPDRPDAKVVPQKFLPEEPSRKAHMSVRKILNDPEYSPEQAHAAWVENRTELGWTYKNVLSEEKKTHPLVTSYDKIQKKYRIRDALFFSMVRKLADSITAFTPDNKDKGVSVGENRGQVQRRFNHNVTDAGFSKEDFSNVTRTLRSQ